MSNEYFDDYMIRPTQHVPRRRIIVFIMPFLLDMELLPSILVFVSFLQTALSNVNSNPFHSIPAFQTPISPLDTPRSVKDGKPVTPQRDLFQDLSSLSPCQKGCSNGLLDSLSLVMKSMSHTQRYDLVCKSYNDSWTCIEEEKKCGHEDHTMFETITSGIRYMCVDQQLAFQNTIQCIDAQSNQVQMECEGECNTKTTIMNLVMRSSITQQIQNQLTKGLPAEGEALAIPQLDATTLNELNQMSSELCQVGDCVLRCVKSKFNARCQGSAGTLLTEVFVRPIAEAQNQLSNISPILGLFMPKSCTYLHNGADLSKYRIDPTMDSELRRMYAEKEAEKQVNNLAAVQQPTIPVPQIISPLDGPTKMISNPLRTPNNSHVKNPPGKPVSVHPTSVPKPVPITHATNGFRPGVTPGPVPRPVTSIHKPGEAVSSNQGTGPTLSDPTMLPRCRP